MIDIPMPLFIPPTPAELRESALKWQARIGPLLIDQWPEALHALSTPTTFVPFPLELAHEWWHEEQPGWSERAHEFAAQLDAHLNWTPKFFRLNSRSPKDAIGPHESLITNSGRQILYTMRGSERMLDDLCQFEHADVAPMLCLRDVLYDCHPGRELRVFLKDGRIKAVAEYGHAPTFFIPPAEDTALRHAVEHFIYGKVAPHLPLTTVVVDLFVPRDYSVANNFTLLELNPYGLSDPVAAQSYERIEAGIPNIARHTSKTT